MPESVKIFIEFWYISIFIVILILFIVLSILSEKKRTGLIKSMALGSGLQFIGKPDKDMYGWLSGFKILTNGHSHKIYNLFKGRFINRPWHFFDFRLIRNNGKNSQTYRQTVALVDIGSDIPAFSLCKENFFHKIGDLIGFKDIDFSSHPGFSDRYQLKGKEQDRIRTLFTSHILSYFESKEIPYNIESDSKKLVIYKPRKTINPKEYRIFIDQAASIAKLFLDSQDSNVPNNR